MSGVYIPGMEMPKTCRKCGLKMNCDNCEGWECYCLPLKKNIGYMDDEPEIPSDKRRDDCPLIPVPDHGRLINADELLEHRFVGVVSEHEKTSYMVGWNSAIEAIVENAPTILPADKED